VPRKLKTYQTWLGFYGLAIAAPSMKAALEAWGAGSNLFHQGHANETHDPQVVAATMSKPGVVLKRPAGSTGRFAEHADLPELDHEESGRKKPRRPEPERRSVPLMSLEDSRKAAAEFEREQKRRDAERRKEDAAREKERVKRERLVAKAQGAFKAQDRGRGRPVGKREAKAHGGTAPGAGIGGQAPVVRSL
jgi:colicin import membrane protein